MNAQSAHQTSNYFSVKPEDAFFNQRFSSIDVLNYSAPKTTTILNSAPKSTFSDLEYQDHPKKEI